MILVNRVITRPNTSIKWHNDPSLGIITQAFFQHIKTVYIDTGACLNESVTISDDQLTWTYTAYWDTMENYYIYDQDPFLQPFWEARNEYYASVGIDLTGTLTITEI